MEAENPLWRDRFGANSVRIVADTFAAIASRFGQLPTRARMPRRPYLSGLSAIATSDAAAISCSIYLRISIAIAALLRQHAHMYRRSALPTWLVALSAVVAPILIAICFLSVLGWANRPMSNQEFRAAQTDPNHGQRVSDRNYAIVLVYALAQLTFLVLGAWKMSPRAEVRVVFLLLGIPVTGMVFMLSVVGAMAK